tara:strand:+ start:9927 stop:10439 length:513 start_codon:yes stop_codon:yes gene_type:complete
MKIEIIALDSLNWFSGSGVLYSFSEIIDEIKNQEKQGIEIHVGTDSDPHGKAYAFVTGIAIRWPGRGGKYWWCRTRINSKTFGSLIERLQLEVFHSIEIASILREVFPKQSVLVHVDCSPDPHTASGKFAKQLQSYALGMGFPVLIKPLSWAASAVADKHAKKSFTLQEY